MKIYSSKYTILFLSLFLFVGGGCKKYLYQGPITSTYGEKFWTTAVAAEQATNAMYLQLRDNLRASRSFFINGDLVAGTFIPSTWWNYQTLRAANNPPFNFSYTPYLPELQDWTRFYKLIAEANIILKNVSAMPSGTFASEDVRNAYLGEALFIRAFAYFYMIRVWGDPVFVTSVYDDADYGNIPPLARTAEGVVIDSCLADLKTASGYLKYTNDLSKVPRASKGAVMALMAHMYAWKHDYINAHQACQDIIDNGGYVLEPMATYSNIWKGKSSNENIWELAMTASLEGNAEASYDFFATFLKDSWVDARSSNCWVSPTNGFVDQFFDKTNDQRFKSIFAKVNASNGDPAGYLLLKYTNFLYSIPETKSNPFINNNLAMFRLSDIYLLNAEALAYTNDLAGAKANLSMTENRAGISSYNDVSSQYDIIDEVVMERGRELIGEGQWYYDLIRTNKTQGWLEYVGYPSDRVNETNKGYYWPLDMGTLFPEDKLLTQNPWWAKNK
ncbi:hypothetical protein A8C56_12095 [Niabella ginsenosidivorans]|uniref:Carbohydrate-binding protein SusD n=1 Tax=Niabella ginsenosidivorans TaxID=1176587 RepID=A0A1A9I4I9_9BACT|nr:RagB/SusD family nutrient uptake outer membrane protein [Niabella ginsenosidivorans]ANH81620.1 hypothetical protein A8C56_12095 [Niabella ginsenosidivorans]